MLTAIIVIHILACVGLIIVVLLQTGKSAINLDRGTSQIAFNSTETNTFLVKLTRVIAIVFMLTSLGLAICPRISKPISVMNVDTLPLAQNSPIQK